MFTTIYLILGHFLADFPFQPYRLVQYKQKYFGGVVIHSMTHLIASLVLLIPFLHEPSVWFGIIIIFVFHNIIDQIKISVNRSTKTNQFITYVVDQLSHLVVICFVARYYIGEITPKLSEIGLTYYANASIPLYLLILILSTYFYDITQWTLLHSLKKVGPYKRNYSLIIRNAIIVTLAFAIYWISA